MIHDHYESVLPLAELQRLKVKRVKRGECPDCGTTLFKTTTGMLGRVKKSIPLNEEGKSHDGRCLVCLPFHPSEVATGGNNVNTIHNENQHDQRNINLEDVTQQLQLHEAKKAPLIPRIILIYQNNDSLMQNVFGSGSGTLPESHSRSGSKSDMGLFGLDLNDEVSEITLDRRIRQTGSGKSKNINATGTAVDPNTIKNGNSSHNDDDDDDDDDDDISEKSLSKHNTVGASSAPIGTHGAHTDSMKQESYREKMNRLFLLPASIDHSEPLQVRMARLLEIDIPTGNTNGQIPDEEIDSEPCVVDREQDQKHVTTAKRTNTYEININDHHRQPPVLSSRNLELAEDSLNGMEDQDNDGGAQYDSMAAVVRKQSALLEKQRQAGPYHSPRRAPHEKGLLSTSSSRRIFRPENLFVSLPTSDPNVDPQANGVACEVPVPDIILENVMKSTTLKSPEILLDRPDIFVERPLDKHYISKPSMHKSDQTPEIYVDLAKDPTPIDRTPEIYVDLAEEPTPRDQPMSTQAVMAERDNLISEKNVRTPNSVAVAPNTVGNGKTGQVQSKNDVNAEIVFDLTALTSLVEDTKSSKGRSRGGGETSNITDDSLMGFATDDNGSSHNQDTEYSAYSSKLLMMIEGSDAEYTHAGSTWPSLRIPRIKADNDELASVLQSYSNKTDTMVEHMTGDVYQETGIPKVVYSSSKEIENSRDVIADSNSDNVGTLEHETRQVQIVRPRSVPISSMGNSHISPRREHLSPRRENPNPSEEIDHLLLTLDTKPPNDCGSVLTRLTDLLWMSNENPLIQQYFIQRNGASILATTIWASMSFPQIEEAAFRLFFALIAVQKDVEKSSDKWNDDLAGLIDAQLVAMQTIISDRNIQKLGCRIFCCLATQKGNSIDGSQSGACLAVLNAMHAHGAAEDVQEWGLRALYNQCVLSQFADTNKNIVISSNLDTNGSSCFNVLERLFRQKSYHLRVGGVMEWLYRLFWCLTASNSPTSGKVPVRLDSLRELLLMLEACRTSADASPQLQEAGLGLIANLVRDDSYKSFLGTPDVVLLILDTMHGNKDFVEVQIEACNAVANIAIILAPADKEILIEAGIIRTIVGAMFAFPDEKAVLLEPALRALLGLAFESESAKTEICESNTLSVIMQASRLDRDSTQPQQELLCMLLASLYSCNRLMEMTVQFDTIGAITEALSTYRKSEKISDAVCCAYRNLSRSDSNFEALLRYNAIGYVVHSMMSFTASKSIPLNACWLLWNLGANTEEGPHKIATARAVPEILIAMQNHLDSYEIIDVACGTLWGLIHRSHVLHEQFFENPTGLELLVCTLVMHPDKVPLLEKVCGILAYGSRNVRAIPADVVSPGVSNVVETMCHHPRSPMILQHGAHFLRSVVADQHDYATESLNVIAVLMDALKASDVPVPFLGEVLYFLWVMAEISSAAKSKIKAMDGMRLTMSILDHFSGGRVPFVEDPALGLLQELTDKRPLQG